MISGERKSVLIRILPPFSTREMVLNACSASEGSVLFMACSIRCSSNVQEQSSSTLIKCCSREQYHFIDNSLFLDISLFQTLFVYLQYDGLAESMRYTCAWASRMPEKKVFLAYIWLSLEQHPGSMRNIGGRDHCHSYLYPSNALENNQTKFLTTKQKHGFFIR